MKIYPVSFEDYIKSLGVEIIVEIKIADDPILNNGFEGNISELQDIFDDLEEHIRIAKEKFIPEALENEYELYMESLDDPFEG